jgi:hypothetical protein
MHHVMTMRSNVAANALVGQLPFCCSDMPWDMVDTGVWTHDATLYTKSYRGATVNAERATGWPVATFEWLHACPYEPCVMLGLIEVCWGITSDIKVKDIRGLLGGYIRHYMTGRE